MNQKMKITTGIVLAILVIYSGYTLFNNSSQPKTLSVGVIAGLTGEYSFVGENYQKGILLAYKLYQKENPQSHVKITVENDGFNPTKGLSAYKKLTGVNKIDALLNMTSPTINAIYSLVTKTDIPVIQVGEQGQDPTNDNIFQIMPGNIITEGRLGEYTKNLNLNRIAVVYTNSTTFIRFFEAFKKGYGGNLNGYKLDMSTKEYRTTVAKILATKPSAVVFLVTPNQGVQIVREIANQSKNNSPRFIFDASLQTGINDYKRILGNLDILNGSVVMTIKQSVNTGFSKEYKEEYGKKPGIGAGWGYDSFNLLMDTYNKNSGDWLDNIRKANFDGADGKVVFNKAGVRIPQFEIKIIKNGKL